MSGRDSNHRVAQPTDEQLLDRYAAGVCEAFDELLRRYQDVAHRVAYRITGNDADAADAVQIGFQNAWRKLATFQRRSSFKTWLLDVVKNAARTLTRPRPGRQTAEAVYAAGRPTAERRGPQRGLLGNERQVLIDRILREEASALMPRSTNCASWRG